MKVISGWEHKAQGSINRETVIELNRRATKTKREPNPGPVRSAPVPPQQGKEDNPFPRAVGSPDDSR